MNHQTHAVHMSIAADLAAVEPVRQALDRLCTLHGVARTVSARLQIMLDELISNVIRHAFASHPGGGDQIAVDLRLDGTDFALTLEDDGAPFDPTQAVFEKEDSRPRPGGRGLDLVKALSDDFTYRREKDRNHVTVTKSLAPQRGEITAMGPGISIEETRHANGVSVALSGRIDSGNAPQLTDHLSDIVRSGPPDMVLDMAGVQYLTSAGFRLLLIVGDAAEEAGGSLVLENLSEEVRELFDLSGLTQAFQIR